MVLYHVMYWNDYMNANQKVLNLHLGKDYKLAVPASRGLTVMILLMLPLLATRYLIIQLSLIAYLNIKKIATIYLSLIVAIATEVQISG